MTQNEHERIDRLEKRVDKIEDSIAKNLQRIFEALEELKVDGAKNSCPSPGACVGLSKELDHVIRAHTATMLRVERLELQLIALNQQKAWIMGAWSVVAIAGAAIGSIIGIIASKYLP